MAVERAAGGSSLIDVLDRVLDKGIVIDAWVRVSLVGIDLITVEARVVVASIDTYLKYSEAVGQSVPVARPALESRPYDELAAENQALRAELSGAVERASRPHRRRRAGRCQRPMAKKTTKPKARRVVRRAAPPRQAGGEGANEKDAAARRSEDAVSLRPNAPRQVRLLRHPVGRCAEVRRGRHRRQRIGDSHRFTIAISRPSSPTCRSAFSTRPARTCSRTSA